MAMPPQHYSAKYKDTFAYTTIKDRLPVILVKVIDFLWQKRKNILENFGENASEELKKVIGQLSELQNEMVTDKPFKPLISDCPDISIWNDYLRKTQEQYGFPPSWFQSSWLYAECYLYKRINQAFLMTTTLGDFDPFHKLKEDSFLSTIDEAVFICNNMNDCITDLKESSDTDKLFHYFRRFWEMCLWSNQWDLSLSAGKQEEDKKNPLTELEKLRQNILVDDTEFVWKKIHRALDQSNDFQLAYVMDNAGFELFCDLCFLHFVHSIGLVKKTRIFVKTIPWFVSDTSAKDVRWLLENLSRCSHPNLVEFSETCSSRVTSGEWEVVQDHFWTHPHHFSQMRAVAPSLYEKMGAADLAIFKGDLNYRKLTADRMWPETTPFKEALEGFLPTSLVSLRTVKAEVIVGLQPGTTDRMVQLAKNWKISGNYAVVQYVEKLDD